MALQASCGIGFKPTCPNAHILCMLMDGAPQGSVLGPLLFLIYVNDILNTVTFGIPCLFADDTKFMEAVSHISGTTHLQHDLDSVSTW